MGSTEGRWRPGGPVCEAREGKRFFFEKKNQKTFLYQGVAPKPVRLRRRRFAFLSK
jgi:hypothetical protein